MVLGHSTVDALLDLKDAGAVTASGAGQVGGSDAIVDLGDAAADGLCIIQVTAIDVSDGDESYVLTLQHSDHAAFGVAAQGTLTVDTQPTNGDTMTIGPKTYTFQTTLTDVDGNIEIGASLGDTQTNIVNAINLTGTPGTGYAASTTIHPSVSIATFSGNAAVITAKSAGAGGNTIATTETFTAGTNVFDAATLGTTTAGVGTVVEGPSIRLGDSSQTGNDADSTTGRYLLPFTTLHADTEYRYLRMYHTIAGTTPSINYKVSCSKAIEL